ncbi:DUF4252 domain-containing protein [Flavobacterium sp.]|uniref:DUF4252 domain-containing protein n=1 Tax=Flavobacterium sp. TaxID=239 RepID=UPI00374FFB4A
MKAIYFIAVALSLLLFSCNTEPSLQKYFVENQNKPEFIALDVSPSILKLDNTKLSLEQSKALSSFKKMNILAFKLNDKNKAQFDVERKKVANILKDTTAYQQLMKFGSGKDGASISFVGDEDHIDEFILYGSKSDNGFAVIRILGNDMNPNDAMTLMSVLKESNFDMKQLESLKGLMK